MLAILLVSFKLVSAIAKDMVNLETATNIAPSLLYTSTQWFLNLIQTQSPQETNEAATASSPSPPTSTEYLVHNWLEAMFAWFQVIILWHDPFISFCVLSGLLSSFLLLTYFAPRLYAVILISILFYNLIKVWFRHVWPEIRVPPDSNQEEEARLDVDRWTYLHPQLMTLSELRLLIKNLMQSSELHIKRLLKLRQEKPVKFCLTICSILSCTAYIGNKITGVCIIFWTIICIIAAPGIYLYILPQVAKDYLSHSIGLKIQNCIKQRQDSQVSEKQEELTSNEHIEPKEFSEVTTLSSLIEHLRRKVSNASSNISKYVPTDCQSKVELDENEKDRQKDNHLRKNSNDVNSSDDSKSLIDSEDDQQDGFVLL